MSFHKIGEYYQPIAPSAGNNGAAKVTDAAVERWFKEAFLPLQHDPYIQIKMDDRNYNRLLERIIIDEHTSCMNSASNLEMPIQEYELDDMRARLVKPSATLC